LILSPPKLSKYVPVADPGYPSPHQDRRKPDFTAMCSHWDTLRYHRDIYKFLCSTCSMCIA
jgi:hypothetical protein